MTVSTTDQPPATLVADPDRHDEIDIRYVLPHTLPEIQQREALDETRIRTYAALYREGHSLGEVMVFQQEHELYVADGFHRIAAAIQAGLDAIPATIRPGTVRDAILYACGCNLHGVPLTQADKRRRVMTMLADPEWQQWSDREIARHCGVSHVFVAKVRKDLTGNVTSERTYRTKHGTTATMDTSHIGTTPVSDTPVVTTDLSPQKAARPASNGIDAPAPERPAIPVVEEMSTSHDDAPAWTPFEEERRRWVEELGYPTLANRQTDHHLVAWAQRTGRDVPIGRPGPWGNPFELEKDGDRATVVQAFTKHYLPHKPSLLTLLPSLAGKVLICFCAPEACHGESLLQAGYPDAWRLYETALIQAGQRTASGTAATSQDGASYPAPLPRPTHRERILAALPPYPKTLAPKQVADQTGLSRKVVQKVLQPMVKRQEVRHVKKGRYGKLRSHPQAVRAKGKRGDTQR